MPDTPPIEKLQHQYQQRIDRFASRLGQLNSKMRWMALVRVLIAVSALATGYYYYTGHLASLLLISLPFIILFIGAVKVHQHFRKQYQYYDTLLKVNREEQQRAEGDHSMAGTGADFEDIQHPYSYDLDIFGEGSVFQLLNRTVTENGRQQLADWLESPANPETIKARQTAITELKEQINWRHEFRVTGRLHHANQATPPLQQPDADTLTFSKPLLILLYGLPALTILLLGLTIVGLSFVYPIGAVLLQWTVTGYYRKPLQRQHLRINRQHTRLSGYRLLFKLIETNKFESALLTKLQQQLKRSTAEVTASEALHSLSKIVRSYNIRYNQIVAFLMNGLLLWDLHCMRYFQRWEAQYQQHLPKWLNTLGTVDALVSLGGHYFNHPNHALPTLTKEQFQLKAEAAGHPLIPAEERVDNDFEIEGFGQFDIITGSNMAGKSTFLRTIGVNLVLAGAGAPVCARSFHCYPIQLQTSMRIKDSLNAGESTFYVELKRLNGILKALRSGQEVFVLLDEILKGTHSQDKLKGSIAFIEQLMQYPASGLIATHDMELTQLADQYPQHIRNYSFEVQIDNGQFSYDYKLKEGICQTRNATELMQQMGITVEGEGS
jgi:DNA mismatch repair ATPase MutS